MKPRKQIILETPARPAQQDKTRFVNWQSVIFWIVRCGLIAALALVVYSLFVNQHAVYAQDQPMSPLAPEPLAMPAEEVKPAQLLSIFIPLITNDTGVVASACKLNDYEAAIMDMMRESQGQQRETLICNPILAKVARERAADMATRGYFNHVNPDGEGPNYLVTEAGFQLPSWYSNAKNANNLESIAAGYKSPAETWDAWMNSSKHETHLLGLEQFYADQEEIGIGYFQLPESEYRHYWVVITAPRE